MRNTARLALAAVMLAAGMLVAPHSGLGEASAHAGIGISQPVPTPLISDIIGEPEPEPEPSQDPGGGGGGGEPGGGGDGDPDGDGRDGDGRGDGDKDGRKGDGRGKRDGRNGDGADGKKGRKKKNSLIPPEGTPMIPGAFTTSELMSISAHLRALGWSAEDVIAGVYPPFIVAGEATWIDTWGVPRYGPGPIVRTHEGQDVFCDYGDPVLAPEAGYVSFSDGGLGGITARVHTPDGAYWYLTHLSDLNTEELVAGDAVQAGTVLGYCGNSGNAETTAPHVHFGWYMPNGVAKNPMGRLVAWLNEAEDRALHLLAEVQGKRQRQLPTLTLARRFGDAFTPDRSLFGGAAGESLWASGSTPETGAFALAEAALQAAFAEHVEEPSALAAPTAEGAGVDELLDPKSTLAKLLRRTHAASESGD